MNILLVLLIVAAAGATLFVLVKGVIGMAQGRDVTACSSRAPRSCSPLCSS
jgi:hypothetical protein